ncbi:MAG TPA: hypothetical protein VEV87_03410 [Chitinophagaceae bacterium]|nr:hypothetical protein [Chitinophagaceae bacterium]
MKYLPKRAILMVMLFISCMRQASAQQSTLDSLFAGGDSTAVLDSLLKDFDSYLDSLRKPKSFFSFNLGIGNGYFSFENNNTVYLSNSQRLIVTPSAGYYHKTGLGITTTGYLLLDTENSQFYQFSITPSYDFIGNRKLGFGFAYTRYFEKDSLPFYTTPIGNELFGYFTYKKWWIRPTLSICYGWGSNTEYLEKQTFIWRERLQRYDRGFIYVKNEESVRDFATIISLRHDFDFFNLFVRRDGFSITPVLLFTAATQSFGFNTSYQYSVNAVRANLLPSNQHISDQSSYRPQSFSFILRTDYNIGKFFVMPQFLLDYYIPETDEHLNLGYSITAGINF